MGLWRALRERERERERGGAREEGRKRGFASALVLRALISSRLICLPLVALVWRVRAAHERERVRMGD